MKGIGKKRSETRVKDEIRRECNRERIIKERRRNYE
jgi:hypothetical protein